MGKLTGKVAFITGSSRGIGRAIAKRFAAEGAKVVLNSSHWGQHGELEGTLEGTLESIRASGGEADAVVCDLLDETARADLWAKASEPFGAPDILVNNAAMAKNLPPSMVSTKHRNKMFDLNVNVPCELIQQALPSFREKGQGWALNISSRTATQPEIPYPSDPMAAHVIGAYGASKAALDRYTEALAHELGSEHIYINALAPTNIVLTSGAEYVLPIARQRPDMVEPVEMMAEAALLLCSGTQLGRVLLSRHFLHEMGAAVYSLDGKTRIGDAQMPADLAQRA